MSSHGLFAILSFCVYNKLAKPHQFVLIMVCLRNKSWKPECVLSFNMGWRILVFYPEPEASDKIYPPIHVKTQSHNLIRTCAGECDWLFYCQHNLYATFSTNVKINYRLPIKVYYRICTLRTPLFCLHSIDIHPCLGNILNVFHNKIQDIL
jgi:hypothetical protein